MLMNAEWELINVHRIVITLLDHMCALVELVF